MKKLLFILLFTGCFSLTKAQSAVYHPLPSDSLVWLESHMDWEGITHYYIKEMIGDTVIGAYNYKKVFQSPDWSSPFYSPSTPLYYLEAIRQDIPAKKIYKVNYAGTETLLYDFNKVLGDTLMIIAGSPNDTLFVSGVDSVMVGTEYHKRFIITNSLYWHDTASFDPSPLIEGVGNEAGFGHYYWLEFENAFNLMCFSVNNVHVYPPGSPGPGSPSCFLAVEIIETEKNTFKVTVMPNPTSDAVHLDIGCKENYSVEITNSAGQTLIQKKDQTVTELTFDVSTYPAGTYFIKLSDSKGNSVVKKIIKQ